MDKLLEKLSIKLTELLFRIRFLARQFTKMEENYSILYPGKSGRAVAREKMQKAMKSILLVFLVGTILLLFYGIKKSGESILKEDYYLSRNKKQYTVQLDATIGELDLDGMEIEVPERIYTERELMRILPAFYEQLEEELLAENETADGIVHPLHFVEELEEFPFSIAWKSSDYKVIDRDGNIGEEVSEEGTLIEITATCTYRDFEEIYTIPLMVYPEDLSVLDLMKRRIYHLIAGKQEETESLEDLALPEEIDGIKIVWKEEKTHDVIMLFVLMVVAMLAILFVKTKEPDKDLARRGEEMMEDYPEIVSKLTLLIGAGLTVRASFKRIVENYQTKLKENQEKRYAYEEMLLCVHEMENGIGEQEAYRHFSVRCREQKYMKLAAVLDQSSRLGAAGMVSQLLTESRDAFEERKSNAEKKGEEAGTKLLVPMFLMLIITMVVIIVPAFLSF
ncbi:MAG: hypothetical protein MJ105_08275 [Lachnospiraceae bacterium]|nr:hypothetical protein [Lachnospiraceae bacterium]